MGENIGSVARAMSNFGLAELRIVAPRDGWPNPKAVEMAAGGKEIIESAKIYENFEAAIADIHITYATTARPRDMIKRVVSPSEVVQEILSFSSKNPMPLTPAILSCNLLGGLEQQAMSENLALDPRAGAGMTKTALVFGPERTGLENEDITLCNAIITIPTDEKNSSLNIAQSSVILGYEWMKGSLECRVWSVEEKQPHSKLQTQHSNPALKQDFTEMFKQLEKYLDEASYFRSPAKKKIMWQNIRNMLQRTMWCEQEIRTFRGMLRALWEYGA